MFLYDVTASYLFGFSKAKTKINLLMQGVAREKIGDFRCRMCGHHGSEQAPEKT